MAIFKLDGRRTATGQYLRMVGMAFRICGTTRDASSLSGCLPVGVFDFESIEGILSERVDPGFYNYAFIWLQTTHAFHAPQVFRNKYAPGTAAWSAFTLLTPGLDGRVSRSFVVFDCDFSCHSITIRKYRL